MTGIRPWIVAVASGLVLAGPGMASASGQLAPWVVVQSQNVSQIANAFASVSLSSATDGWAVGTRQVDGSTDFRTLAEHFDGRKFSVVHTPNPATIDRLFGVVDLAPNNVWAVGNDFNLSTLSYQTLVEHFDGTAWSVVSSPNRGTRYDALQSVAATGSSDVWAVGATQTSGQTIRNLSLIEHFDGTAWAIVPSPNPRGETNAQLLGATALSATDVWAVGFGHGGAGTLAEHWDGRRWSIVRTPNVVQGGSNQLTSVNALATNDVWAVGSSQAAGGAARTLTEHWDGSSWTIVPSPNEGNENNWLFGVTHLSATDLWSVGVWVKQLPEGGFVNQTLTQRWNGSAWTTVASPDPGLDNILLGTAAVGPSLILGVGGFTNSAQDTLAIANRNG
jgi:hypothetical protein